ncbi:hypothetical protein [Devosia sp.]|uniref:hypothetical protein n=1 Tax=Devosia sp. TaxID=1871048 RepID=UPI002AFF13AA|nr:hypothetical protein [Devosia sp.]
MMKNLVRGLVVAAISLAAVMPALASPAGKWEIEFRDSRYDVSLCGDGTQLCAKLIWLGNGADNKDNLPYLNSYIINGAVQKAPGRWDGTLNLYGHKAAGTITQVAPDQLTIRGCFLVIVCKSFQMYRMAD